MRRTQAAPLFGLLFLISLIAIQLPRIHAQAPAGASVAVRMIDAIDSSKDPAGKQYRASVTSAVDAGNGVMIPQGASALLTLANNSGSGWTTQLVSVTVNGQPVAISTGSVSVTSAAQSAAGAAMSSVNSMLGGFGRRVNTPAAATAIATGQRVVLPPGTALSFVLSQSPAPNSAPPPAAVASAPPSPAVAVAAAPIAPQAGTPVAAAGQHWWMCQYVDPKDPPVLGKKIYFAVVASSAATRTYAWPGYAVTDLVGNPAGYFSEYVQQNYKITDTADLKRDPYGNYNGHFGGYCRRIADSAAGRTNTLDTFKKQWASSTPPVEAIQVDFADTPAQDAAIDARIPKTSAPAAQAPSSGNSKECDYHATCSSQAPKL